MRLYELTQNYVQLQEMIEENEQELFIETLQAIEDAIESKAENIGKMIQSLNAECEVIKNEEKRLADKRKAVENKVSHLKQYLQQQLEFAGLIKVKSPTITVSIQKNPASCEIVDESLIPVNYRTPQPDKIDKKAIIQLLKDGQEVPGATIKQSHGLRIR